MRDEVQGQLASLGLATRRDLDALGRSIRDDLTARESKASPAPGPARETSDR